MKSRFTSHILTLYALLDNHILYLFLIVKRFFALKASSRCDIMQVC